MSALTGRRVLITRAAEDQGAFADRLRARGAEPSSFPCVSFSPIQDRAAIDAALDRFFAEPPQAVAVASPRAAAFLLEEFDRRGLDPAAALASCHLAAAGAGTQHALAARGVSSAIPPEGAGGGPLAKLLIDGWHANHWDPKQSRRTIERARILIPQPVEATPLLADSLRAAGFAVEPLALYETVALSQLEEIHRPGLALLRSRQIDAIAFASGSAVRGFAQLLRGDMQALVASTRIACIGESTAAVARAAGLSVVAIGEHGFDSLLDALAACYSAARNDVPTGGETKT